MSSSNVDVTGNRPRANVPFGGEIRDKDWLERADHPLLNDLILKLVFGHVRRYDLNLKACRSVCKKWNEHTIPHMRSTYQVTIHGKKSEEENSETRHFVDFVKLFKYNKFGIPFEKYRLGPFRTTNGAGKKFLQMCGEFIKEIDLFQLDYEDYVRAFEYISDLLKFSPKLESLTLCGEFVSRSGNVVKLFPNSTPVLPHLKKLTVDTESDFQISAFNSCPTFFDELFSVACNICHIAIDDGRYRITTLVLNSIGYLGRESSIQSLSLKSVSSEEVEILRRMAEKPNGLKLKEFSFKSSIDNENRNRTVKIQLATILKDTLEDYNVIDESRSIDLLEFPKMPKLKSIKLRVWGHFGDQRVNLNQIFPLIETLNIEFRYVNVGHHGYLSYIYEYFSQFQVCPTIMTLILNYYMLGFGTFPDILRVFPNLRKLTLSVRERMTRQILVLIWAGMTQLESLSLVANIKSWNVMELDSLVTGIPIQGLIKICHVIPGLEKMTVEKRREKILNLVEEHRTLPSIRDLTNLKNLKLDINTELTPFFNVSDLTGYFGIYLLKHLNHVNIQHCGFTKTCCEILTKETGVEA